MMQLRYRLWLLQVWESGILTELEVEKAPMPLNLSYIPLETDGIQEILYVIYSRKNENPLIPLFLEEMKKIGIPE